MDICGEKTRLFLSFDLMWFWLVLVLSLCRSIYERDRERVCVLFSSFFHQIWMSAIVCSYNGCQMLELTNGWIQHRHFYHLHWIWSRDLSVPQSKLPFSVSFLLSLFLSLSIFFLIGSSTRKCVSNSGNRTNACGEKKLIESRLIEV